MWRGMILEIIEAICDIGWLTDRENKRIWPIVIPLVIAGILVVVALIAWIRGQ